MTPYGFQITWSKVKFEQYLCVEMLSTQYLFTPSVEICQTRYNGYRYRVFVSYRFSGLMVEGQGQIIGLNPLRNGYAISCDPLRKSEVINQD